MEENEAAPIRITTIVGARPQFVKAAVVQRALQTTGRVHESMIHTGQHYDAGMSDIFFDELGIRAPNHHLGIGSGNHGHQTGAMLGAIEQVLLEERPDWVLVYGDTNSTLAGTLAAAKLNLKVAHVEAGLRSFNRRMPEEVNRVLTDHASSVLFVPTHEAIANLRNEGITGDHVRLVGDVMLDAVKLYGRRAAETISLERWGLDERGYAIGTLHRQENTDDPVRLFSILDALVEIHEDLPVVLPLHPRTRKMLDQAGLSAVAARLRLLEPVSYLEMQRLLSGARIVLTDSGGLQKEAYFHGVPCVTLRDETEWVETVTAGWNHLAGADRSRILAATEKARSVPSEHPALYGDGHASERIATTLLTLS